MMEFRYIKFISGVAVAIWLGWLPMLAIADSLAELESARQKLAAAHAAVVTAKGEFRTLLDQGGLTQSEKEDFQVYLTRLEQVVVDNCEAVLKLKVALGDNSSEAGCSFNRAASAGAVSFPDERTEDERVIALDGQLAKSMSDFDELLLREMEELKRRQSSAPDGGGGAGGAGGDGQGEGGTEGVAARDKGEGDESRTQPSQSEPTGQQQTASRQSGDEQSAGNGGQNNDNTTTQTKRDAPPEDSDDDIVARQLREAAESETDPELREKLWEEYRRYKADTATKAN